jgi:predicted Kef-type K+ transport protein
MNSNTELGFLLLVPVFEIALHKPFGEILEKKIWAKPIHQIPTAMKQ